MGIQKSGSQTEVDSIRGMPISIDAIPQKVKRELLGIVMILMNFTKSQRLREGSSKNLRTGIEHIKAFNSTSLECAFISIWSLKIFLCDHPDSIIESYRKL
jgi:hypothetical protein